MAVEILTVSLSDESIARLAMHVAGLIKGDIPTTQSNPPSSQNPQGAERQGFQPEARAPQDDPWAEQTPLPVQQAPVQQNVQQANAAPLCKCGQPKRWVPPGNRADGSSYRGFWACPQPRGQQCPR